MLSAQDWLWDWAVPDDVPLLVPSLQLVDWPLPLLDEVESVWAPDWVEDWEVVLATDAVDELELVVETESV